MLNRRPGTPLQHRYLALLLLLSFTCACVHAQATGGTAVALPAGFHAFDVISVKADKSGSGGMSIESHDLIFHAKNVSTLMMISNATGIRDTQISGLPSWASNARWDVNAKILDADPALKNRKLSDEQATAEWRAHTLQILVDRFHLKTHTETVTAPTYDLVIAKGGSKLKDSDPTMAGKGSMMVNGQELKATYAPASSLLQFLAGQTGRDVVDKTGLNGHYDMELHWSPEDQTTSAADTGSTQTLPSLFTALEEQLGLKLVPDKGPVTKLIVDSIDMPAED